MPEPLLPVPYEIIEKLNPAISKVCFAMGVLEFEFGEDYTSFYYKGLKITIEIKAKPK